MVLPLAGNDRIVSPFAGYDRILSPIPGNDKLLSPFNGNDKMLSPLAGNEDLQNILDDEGHDGERRTNQVEDGQTDESFFRRQPFAGKGDEGGEADDAHQRRRRVVHKIQHGQEVVGQAEVSRLRST